MFVEAIEKAHYSPGEDIYIALDSAASEFYENGKYIFKKSSQETFDSSDLVDFYVKLVEKYPIISIEDGLAEDDWAGWKILTEKLGNRIQLVGDDLYVTNIKRFQKRNKIICYSNNMI